jgi:hypothetical protein
MINVSKRWEVIQGLIEQGLLPLDKALDALYMGNIIETKACAHEYVNVGFNSVRMVCKHCDKEQGK